MDIIRAGSYLPLRDLFHLEHLVNKYLYVKYMIKREY